MPGRIKGMHYRHLEDREASNCPTMSDKAYNKEGPSSTTQHRSGLAVEKSCFGVMQQLDLNFI
jgi:hypothetical protein